MLTTRPLKPSNICVTWQGTDYKLPEDDTIVSKCVCRSVNICEIIVYLVVIVQNITIYPFKYEAQTALFKDPVRTAL